MEGQPHPQHLNRFEEEDTTAMDLEDFEIVEHEQAHVVAMAAVGCDALMEEPSRLNQEKSSDSTLEPFLDHFSGMINHTNLRAILGEQEHMLATMEVTNEKLASLNDISEKTYAAFSGKFRQQTQALVSMKKQLESCFRRIRFLKSKLASQYPEAYQAALTSQRKLDEEENETEAVNS